MKATWAALLSISACAPIRAEVGSGFPPDASELDAAPPCDARAALRLYHWNAHPSDTTNGIDFLVKVENTAALPLALSALEIRYYFTNELAPPTVATVYYSDTCCSNKIMFNDQVVASLVMTPGKPKADSYLSIAFDPTLGDLAPADAVQVELGFHDPQFARDFTQTNDYSFVPSATATQTEWDTCPGPQCPSRLTTCTITVHQNDALVWGLPP